MKNKIDIIVDQIQRDESLKPINEAYKDNENILVSIRCATYNHKKYIRKCIDGFLMQKVNFNVEILIHDDASTDGTTKILKEYAAKYPKIIKLILEKENQYSKDKSVIAKSFLPFIRGKYVAMCEGDDYWISPYKIAIQTKLMELYKECSMCVARANVVNSFDGSFKKYIPNTALRSSIISQKKLMKLINGNYIFQTSTYFRRTKDYMSLIYEKPKFALLLPNGDSTILRYSALKGKFIYINKSLSQYNYLTENSWTAKFKATSLTYQQKRICQMIEGLRSFDNYSHSKYTKYIQNYITELYIDYFYQEDVFIAKFKEAKFRQCLLMKHPKIYFQTILRIYTPKLYFFLKGKLKNKTK